MADDIVLPIPNLDLPQYYFTLTQPKLEHLHQDALKGLLEGIEKDRTYLLLLRIQRKCKG
jgi:26S proteasome regulatory subunit N7